MAAQSILEEIYDGYVEKIYRFFFYKVVNREVAEDLTSQTFLTFARAIKTRDDIDNHRSFLFGVAKNIFLKFLREKYTHQEKSLDEIEEFFEAYVDTFIEEADSGKHVLDMLEKALPGVPEKQQLVLRLRFLEGRTIQEIATMLGKDENYVSTTQKRGLQSLRKVISCTDEGTNITV